MIKYPATFIKEVLEKYFTDAEIEVMGRGKAIYEAMSIPALEDYDEFEATLVIRYVLDDLLKEKLSNKK